MTKVINSQLFATRKKPVARRYFSIIAFCFFSILLIIVETVAGEPSSVNASVSSSENLITEKTSLPLLNGQDAVEHLKMSGDYNRLGQAFKETRANQTTATAPIEEQQKVFASDGAGGANFGLDVAVAGDVAIVGAYKDNAAQGAAYVFVRNSSGIWTQQQKLTASDGAPGDLFGFDIEISSDTAVIGAYGDNISGADQGSAYIFTRNGSVWTQQQKLTANDGAAADGFGYSVGISNDKIIIGAYGADIAGNLDQGAAYVFKRGGSAWMQEAKLTANDGAASDFFGQSVGIDGSSIVVGADRDLSAASTQPFAYVFVSNSPGTWSQQQKLAPDVNSSPNYFSGLVSVIINENTIVIGAYGKGAVYIYVRTGASWNTQANITSSAASDGFGYSLAMSGEQLVIGAPLSNAAVGAAYVFVRNGAAASWTQRTALVASDGNSNDYFGYRVAINNNTVLAGAAWDEICPNQDQGSAFFFDASTFPITGQQEIQQSRLPLDKAKSPVIKVNHEFKTDLIKLLPKQINGSFDRPHFFSWPQAQFFEQTLPAGCQSPSETQLKKTIFDQASEQAVINQTQRITANDGGEGDFFGYSIALSGDTAVIGALYDRINTKRDQGSAYVFVRNSMGEWTFQAKLIAGDGAANDHFGGSVAIDGNLIVVGAPQHLVGTNTNQGAAYVFVRTSTTSWTQQARLVADDGASGDYFGLSVDLSGETAIIGSPGSNLNSTLDQGAAYIYIRTGTTWSRQQKLRAADGSSLDQFGDSVALSGNTAIVGADYDDINSNSDQGSAYVFVRTGTTWSEQAKLVADDGASGDYFGSSLDVSGETIVVTAPLDDVNSANQGSAYIFVRTGANWTKQTKLYAGDGAGSDIFGSSVALSGNTLSVGANYDDLNFANQGSAYVFVRTGTTWNEQAKLTTTDGGSLNYFGSGVAIDERTILVGAPGKYFCPNEYQGAAYFFNAAALSSSTSLFDFDGDGKADVSVFRPSNGVWYRLSSGSNNSFFAAQFGVAGDRIAPADFDGDGKTDQAVFRPVSGTWYLLQSTEGFAGAQFGQSGDVPAPGDFDGDGKADLAVFRPSTGVWYLNRSGAGFNAVQFGQPGDIPQVGDFDGDGKADISLYRPSNGVWYRLNSSNNQFVAQAFGAAEDKPDAADFDGDGKTDLSVFRPSTGIWYLQQSTNGFTAIQFGQSGDSPAAADFDGDGKADVSVFRPSTGVWYLNRSNAGFTAVQFGQAGDLPIESAFVSP